jgi:hypothetical protein
MNRRIPFFVTRLLVLALAGWRFLTYTAEPIRRTMAYPFIILSSILVWGVSLPAFSEVYSTTNDFGCIFSPFRLLRRPTGLSAYNDFSFE